MNVFSRFAIVAMGATLTLGSVNASEQSDGDELKARTEVQSFHFRVDSNGEMTSEQDVSELSKDMRQRIEKQIKEARRRAEEFKADNKPFSQSKVTITVVGPDGKKTVQNIESNGHLQKLQLADAIRKSFGDRTEMADRVADRIMASRESAGQSGSAQSSMKSLEDKVQAIIDRLDRIETELAEMRKAD